MMRISLAMLMAAALAAGPAQAGKGDESPDRVLAGRMPGTPVQCISQTRILDTRTFNDGSIYYRMSGSVDYLNRPYQCSQLRASLAYSTASPSTQLCSGDILRIFDPSTRTPYGACAFSDFVPYPKVHKRP